MTAWFRTIARSYSLITYFVLAFAFTWIGSLIYYFTIPKGGQALPSILGLPGVIVWYYGPALAAFAVTRVLDGTAGIRQLLRRLLIWRVGWGWCSFTFYCAGWVKRQAGAASPCPKCLPGGMRWLPACCSV